MKQGDNMQITPYTWFNNSPKAKFKVPVYQRLFAWEKPQFDRLLSDLKQWSRTEPYYLGIITVVKKAVNNDYYYVLIDGQQRLTVIAILAGIFGWGQPNSSVISYLDYEARPNDRLALDLIWKSGPSFLGCNNIDELNKKLAESNIASDSMCLFIKHIYENKNDWQQVIKELCSNLTLLISCLPKDYDLKLQNEYFEKMNSAGKQLEPHEILKIQICKKESDFENWNNVEDFTKRFQKVNDIETDGQPEESWSFGQILKGRRDVKAPKIYLKRDNENEEKCIEYRVTNNELDRTSLEKWRPSLIDFPMLLLHILWLKDKTPIPEESYALLKTFLYKDTQGFVSTMCDYRAFLDKWVIHKSTDSFLDESEQDTSDYSYWNDDNYEIKTISNNQELKQVQMAFCAFGRKRQEWLLDVFTGVNDRNDKTLLKFLISLLLKKADFKSNILTDSNKLWPDEYLTYKNNIHAQFICLDYFLWLLANTDNEPLRDTIFGNEIPEAIIHFIPKANRSVEHFHPQTDVNSQNTQLWNQNITNTTQQMRDMFGNLALISPGRNSEYGNQSIAGKSERIELLIQRKELESIKLYLMMKKCDKQESKWTPDLAHEHANDMLMVLKWGMKFYDIKAQEGE